MKSWKTKWPWVLMLLSVFALVISCEKDESDDDDQSDDDSSADDDTQGSSDDDTEIEACKTNIPPELLSVQYVLNGAIVQPPVVATWPEDEVGILFEYRDQNCNLVDGHYGLSYTNEDGEREGVGAGEYFDETIGCSSEEVGHPYSATLRVDWFTHTPPFSFFITDTCLDSKSNEIELQIQWTVSE